MEVEEKIEEMQKYIPCLRLLIDNLEKNPAKEEQVKKMKYLLEMLVNKDPSIKLETLVRCEGILQKIYGKEQILSSSAENDSRKVEKEVQNQNKEQDTSNNEAVSDTNKPKLVNGNSSETTGVVENQSSYSPKTTVNEVEQPVVVNDDDKGGGDGALTVDSSKSKTQGSSHKVEGNSNGKEEHESDATNKSGLIIQKAESLTNNAPKSELIVNELEDANSKPLQLENDIKSNDSIKNSGEIHPKDVEYDEPKVVNEPTGDGDCDMDIDEELTNTNVSKALSESQTLESQTNEASAGNKEMKTAEGSKLVSTSTPTASKSTSSSKSSFVDLTSDDSNDETPKTPTAKPPPPLQKITPKPVDKQIEKINLQPTKPSEKPATVYLIKQKNDMSNSQNQTQNKVPTVTPPAAKVEKPAPNKANNEPNKTIMTIDLLDSDSDDEGKSNSKSKTSKPDGKVQMPTPKMLGDKPMFTIASVQSISTLQQHQEKRREVERELYAIVKSIQYTTHHTVPQKHNAAVTAYLERFIKDLMFEKNRVNLCLQKLLKTLEPDKYKQVKRIIQTYCSEPVNDPNLPTPSPFCHRIKVYPEKLQFVMRQMFFFNTGISVVGYKVFSLVKNNQTPNGIARSPTSLPVMDQKKSPQKPVGQTIIHQKPQLARPLLPKPPPLVQRSISMPVAKPPLITPPTNPPTSSSESNLLAPMKSHSVPTQPVQKPKRRRHGSDDDDDDDESYVPQGYFSESDEQTEESSDTPRRTSLQRASKIRCQKYLELERTIDDETYIRATEATIARALKGEGRPKTTSSQPPLKKYKPASALKKKKPTQIEEDGDSKASQDSETREREDDTEEDSQPPTKRARRSDKNNPDGIEDMDAEEDDEDDEPAPELDTTVENLAKNVTRAYHCRSKYIDKCLICHERTLKKCAISHYVNAHRDREVFIARLHKGDILKLQSETMCFAFPSSNAKSSAYVAYCIFCRQEQCLSMRNWYEHYTRHTGEYLYECSQCNARRSTRQQINRHINVECSKKGSTVVMVKEVDPDTIRIDACVCLLCNYVQLDFERLVRHMQNEHEFPGAIHELPDGTYQVLNLLRIEQNYYDSSKYDTGTGIPSEIEETIPEDDMSFMICNMLASANDQVPIDPSIAGNAISNEATMVPPVTTDPLVAADAESQVTAVEPTSDPLQSDYILPDSESKPDDESPQTPEMIVPDEPIIPAVIVRTDEDEDDSELPSTEADTDIEKTSAIRSGQDELANDKKDPEIQQDNKSSDKDQGSQDSMEALQLEDSIESNNAEIDSSVQDQNSTESQTQNKSDQISATTSNAPADSKDNGSTTIALESDSSTLEQDPLDTSSEATENPKSLLSELNLLEDLTKSATESIFQRVSDSLINSVYGSVEISTSLSSNAISSENTMDSEESGPQFLQQSESPIDPVLLTVHETIVPDLDGGNVAETSEQIDGKEEDNAAREEAQVSDDIDDLILPESMENSPRQAECITDELIVPECCDVIPNSDKLDSSEIDKKKDEEKEPEELNSSQESEELLEAAKILPDVADELQEVAEILPDIANELSVVQEAEILPDPLEAESTELNESSASIEDIKGAGEESNVLKMLPDALDPASTEPNEPLASIDDIESTPASVEVNQLAETTEKTPVADPVEEPQTDAACAANPESTTIESQSADSEKVKETNFEQEPTAEAATSEPQEAAEKTIDEEPIAEETDDKVEEAPVDTPPEAEEAANEKSTENSTSETATEALMTDATSEVDKIADESSTQPSPPETVNETQESGSTETAPLEKGSG